jgi:hypothetical protein
MMEVSGLKKETFISLAIVNHSNNVMIWEKYLHKVHLKIKKEKPLSWEIPLRDLGIVVSYATIRHKALITWDAVAAIKCSMSSAASYNQRDFTSCILDSEKLAGDAPIASDVSTVYVWLGKVNASSFLYASAAILLITLNVLIPQLN